MGDAVDDEVEEDFDATGVCFGDEIDELLFGAEAGVELVGAAVLVAVVCGGGEDGVHPDGGDTEGFEVIEGVGHTLEVAV